MATIACVPTASAAVGHAAVRLLPLPTSATVTQPAIPVPFAVNATLPVGALPVTVAVNVTVAPTVDGLTELASVVLVAVGVAVFTTCDNGVLVEPALPLLPT